MYLLPSSAIILGSNPKYAESAEASCFAVKCSPAAASILVIAKPVTTLAELVSQLNESCAAEESFINQLPALATLIFPIVPSSLIYLR